MRLIVLICFLYSNASFAQLYLHKSKSGDSYAELFKDSAHVEIFKTHCHHWCTAWCIHNEILLPKRSGDTLFSGKHTHILTKHSMLFLHYKKPNRKRYVKLEISKTAKDDRDSLRRFAKYLSRRTYVTYLLDSLSGPTNSIKLHPDSLIRRDKAIGYTFHPNSKMIDNELDSLLAEIMRKKDPVIDSYYRKIDSLKFIDSTTAFNLLTNTNYQLRCGQYLLRQIAKERPELLIRYIDKKPTNTQVVLETIKGHDNFKEITGNVRSCNINSAGKNIIVKQRSKRMRSNILEGFIVTGYILWELAVIGLIVLLFTKI